MFCHARSGTLGAIGGLCPGDCLRILFMIAPSQLQKRKKGLLMRVSL
jgi:hypothetical protein